MTKTLGRYIRELRDQADISLREFAGKIEVSAAHLSDIELGRRFPSPELLERIARKLGVPISELEGHDSRPPVDDIRRLSEADPAFGFAFRQLIDHVNDKKLTADEMLKSMEKHKPGDGGKK